MTDERRADRLNEAWDALVEARPAAHLEETAAIQSLLRRDAGRDPNPVFVTALRERLVATQAQSAGSRAAPDPIGLVQPFPPRTPTIPGRPFVAAIVAAALIVFILWGGSGLFSLSDQPGAATAFAATTTPTATATRTTIFTATERPATIRS